MSKLIPFTEADDKALYVDRNDPTRRGNLRASEGYGWLYILDALATNLQVTSYEDTTDDALSSYRDVYDRSSAAEVDVLRSMFRYLEAFTSGYTLPNLETIVTTSITPEMQTKLNNVIFEYDIGPNVRIPDLETKCWKIFYFMWLVHRGVLIKDSKFFELFDVWKPQTSFGLPTLTTNTLFHSFAEVSRRCQMIPNVVQTVNLPCVLVNANNTPFADLDDINTSFSAAAPVVADLDKTTANGVYLMRKALIPKNKDVMGVKTSLVLRIVMDAYETRTTVMDMRAMVALAPYQVVSQCILHFAKPNRIGSVEISTANVLAANKSADMSAPASFFHVDYVSTSEPIMYMRVLDVLKATIKDNVLVVELEVDDTLGTASSDFMTTPTITLAEIDSAPEYEVPASELQTIRYPPINTSAYIFTASTVWDNTLGPEKAFDRNNTTRWASARATMNRDTGWPIVNNNPLRLTVSSGTTYSGDWIQVQLPVARVFKSLGFRGEGLHQYLVCGSLDGITWTTLLNRDTNHGLQRDTDHTISFTNNDNAYFYYRFVVLRGIPGQIGEAFSINELWFNEIAGSEIGFMREDLIMACKDPNTLVNVSLNNLFRA